MIRWWPFGPRNPAPQTAPARLSYLSAGRSHAGARPDNEDAWGTRATPDGGVWVLADGLGGHADGARAARLAVDSLLTLLGTAPPQDPQALNQALELTQQALGELPGARTAAGPRTTVVVLTCVQDRACWAHVGDLRLYHFRAGTLLSRTLDHSVPQALVAAGTIPATALRGHEDRNRLLRCLGSEGPVRPTLTEPVTLQPGDALLLCNNGLREPRTVAQSAGSPWRRSGGHPSGLGRPERLRSGGRLAGMRGLPGAGPRLVYVNDEELLAPTLLQPYDRIEIGASTLAFVPFCGECRQWMGDSTSALCNGW
jgi:serine/threonine protein phosphatase PrpC